MSTKTMTLPKTMDDVAKALNIDFAQIHAGIMQLPMPEKDKLNMIADYEWEKIVEAYNNGWLANYGDSKQDKYFPYAWVKADESDPSGFALTNAYAGWTYSDTYVGARLLFREHSLALNAIKQFEAQYKAAILARREK